MEPDQECEVCGEPAELSCTSCNKTYYCNKLHQRQHWFFHQHDCPPFASVVSQDQGTYIVATRRLRAGQLIINDTPLVVGPLSVSTVVCISCHGPAHSTRSNGGLEMISRCSKCRWPVCSPGCLKRAERLHSKRECIVLSKDPKGCGVPVKEGSTPRYDIIMVVRALLLREDDPDAWNLLLSLESHVRQHMRLQDEHHIAVVRYITEVLKMDVTKDIVHEVRGVILTNAIEIRGPNSSRLRAVYPNISRLNHSCLPNVHLSTDTKGTMYARAAVDITKKEPLVICYTGTTTPLWERMDMCKRVHFFSCSCKRCQDPSELGTCFSFPRCPSCPGMFMKPRIHILRLQFFCSKCRVVWDKEDAEGDANEWLVKIEQRDIFGSGSVSCVRDVVDKVDSIFHSKHYVSLAALQAAIRALQNKQELAARQLRRDLWQRCAELYDVLEPGYTRRRGMTLCETATAILDTAQEEHSLKILDDRDLIRQRVLAQNMFKEADCILCLEPEDSPMRAWRTKISENLIHLRTVLSSVDFEEESLGA
ncbi:SET domain-containing protein SmydA-8-like [Oratosquilla oratoria]|uniref:SET domain-containing protein SmydA-8-like n=1 Tax=Oratosquilla oratoria TaxID=337810 RepID=UPI003F7724D1